MKELSKATRREFMKKAGALSVMQAATPLAASLSLMNNAVAQTVSVNDYKALVCVFMYGANDHYGTVVPYDNTLYGQYNTHRRGAGVIEGDYQGIALLHNKLLPLTTTARSSFPDYALHPAMDRMQALFNAGRAGIVMNVGPLLQPTTLAEFKNKSVPLPPNLMSHNNQQAYWQTAVHGGHTGWGGRMAELFLTEDEKISEKASLTCISVTGDALFLSGKTITSTKMSKDGVATINPLNTNWHSTYGNPAGALEMIRALSTSPGNHMMTAQYAQVMGRSLETHRRVADKIGTRALMNSAAESNPLAQQLQMVARMIERRADWGLKRQVFMVGIGGFDLHDNLVSQHPKLLKMVSDACAEFDATMASMGVGNMVTTFTASDFGRTLSSNGDGSDHGWGSHHFVLGGAVNGGQFYGTPPDQIGLAHSQSIGHGILLPTTSLEQMFVPIAQWFGVADSYMASVFPNAEKFPTSLQGLMGTT
jgi:uncharacterized protein (DUF1501 family)